jgi:hypothetical protein
LGRDGYKKHAWGSDELLPLKQEGQDWFGLGLTIVDAIDSLYLMGLHEQAAEARDWIETNLHFDVDTNVNLFEVSIRLLGGLLGAYTMSGDSMFLERATDLGERLLPAFASPSGIPYSDVNLKTHKAQNPKWGKHSSLAEVSSVQLEFKYLAHLTGREELRLPAEKVMNLIAALPKEDGLAPIWITPETGKFHGSKFSLGARGDSYYEYLLKQWLITGGTEAQYWKEYQLAMQGVQTHLLGRLVGSKCNNYPRSIHSLTLGSPRSKPGGLLFVGERHEKGFGSSAAKAASSKLTGESCVSPSDLLTRCAGKMDHLVCFLPGVLALGVASRWEQLHQQEDTCTLNPNATAQTPNTMAEALRTFYTKHNPQKLSIIDKAVEIFGDNDDGLNVLLRAKYGADLTSVAWSPNTDSFQGAETAFSSTDSREEAMQQQLMIAEELLHTCYAMYNTTITGLSPEIAHFKFEQKQEAMPWRAHEQADEQQQQQQQQQHQQTTPTAVGEHTLRSSMGKRWFNRTVGDYSEDIEIKDLDAHNLLRPETVESLFILYRLTGDRKYQEWGWNIFQSFEKHCRVSTGGYAGLNHVTKINGAKRDKMESFFMAETLKYLFLLFEEENSAPPTGGGNGSHPKNPGYLLPLEHYVLNTEAHPFLRWHG